MATAALTEWAAANLARARTKEHNMATLGHGGGGHGGGYHGGGWGPSWYGGGYYGPGYFDMYPQTVILVSPDDVVTADLADKDTSEITKQAQADLEPEYPLGVAGMNDNEPYGVGGGVPWGQTPYPNTGNPFGDLYNERNQEAPYGDNYMSGLGDIASSIPWGAVAVGVLALWYLSKKK